jgi:hypothetical protein
LKALAVTALLALASPGLAQPSPDVAADKGDAKALMQSGLKLLAAKDYLGALAVFKDAYARFPSPKILLNIGTTYKLLGRQADAANTYQHYLDTDDADAKRRAEIGKLLADIDKTVGIVELAVTPVEAEVQFGEDWAPSATLKLVRVPAGKLVLRARLDGYAPKTTSVDVAVGDRASVEIQLVAIEKPRPVETVATPAAIGVVASAAPAARRSRVGLLVLGHIDIPHGWAPLVGLTADVTSRLQLDAAAILGSFYGAYVGARFALLPGRTRPFVAAGMPVFRSNGLRYGARGAAGLEYELSRHLAVIAEVGIEHDFNVEMGKAATLFVPAIGVSGRL